MIKNNEMPKYLKNLLNSFQLKCAVTKGEKVKKIVKLLIMDIYWVYLETKVQYNNL